jgi:hypothetical protein
VVVGIYNERQANMVAEDVRLAEEYLGGREIDG